MYFVIAFFTVTFVGALISARTLCGYNDISPWWKVAVFLLLWTVWAMPAVLGGLRTKGWLEGPVYNTLALGGYFLFGFAFLLLMLLLFRDFVWAVSYGLAKLSGHASAGWSPVNTVALTKANLITLALALLLSLYALYEGVKTPRVREIVIETSKTDREIKILQINDMHIDRSKPVKWFADMVDLANEYHEKLMDAVTALDDDLAMMYLEGEEIPVEKIKAVIRKATIDNEMVPIVCGTSYKNKGVQELLDAVVDYMPSPLDKKGIRGINPETEEEDFRPASDDAPFSALAFKIATDPYVGKLCYFRVYSGTLEKGTTVLNCTKGVNERMGRILQMHANHREDIEKVYAGDIAAVVGVKNTTTGDTLCDEDHPIILESMVFPEPVIEVAIEPKTKAGQEKMGIALSKLAEEDPTFRTYTNKETGQTIIAGMGELHLEIIVDRLLREFKVEANVGAPQVSYKETIRKAVDQETKYARQSGGKGQYGHVKIHVEPNEPGKGYEFINAVVGGAIPKEYIPAVDAGIQGAMEAGVLAGYPVVDVKVTLYDGSYHEVDSSEMAFKIAGSMAFKEACKKADPVILEPIMKVSVNVPDEYMGTVIGDITARRGNILGQITRTGSVQIDANVPLAEMFGYATDLRSKTQGRGNYSMEPSHNAELPKSKTEEIVKSRGKD